MKEYNRVVGCNYYAYSFEEKNQVYLVRGVDPYSYEDEVIKNVPDDLIERLVFEEYMRNDRIVDIKNRKAIISYSFNHCYAVIDFNARSFTNNQVMDVVYGRKVKGAYSRDDEAVSYSHVTNEKEKPFIKKLISIIKH